MFPTLVCFWYTNLTSAGGSCYCSRDERERKKKTISQYWTQAEQNLQERQKKLDYTSAWTWDQDHKTSLKPVSIELFFGWSSCEIGEKHTDEVRIKNWLSSERTTRTHTKLGGHTTQGERRKVVVFGALLAARVFRPLVCLLAKPGTTRKARVWDYSQSITLKVRDLPENYLYWCLEGKQKKTNLELKRSRIVTTSRNLRTILSVVLVLKHFPHRIRKHTLRRQTSAFLATSAKITSLIFMAFARRLLRSFLVFNFFFFLGPWNGEYSSFKFSTIDLSIKIIAQSQENISRK